MYIFQMIRARDILRHNVVFFTGSLLAAALNYLFHPVLGRLLGVAQFGEVQTLISLFTQMSILFTVTSIIITNLVANAQKNKSGNLPAAELERLMLVVSVLLFFIAFLLVEPLRRFFHFESAAAFYALLGALLVTFPLTIGQAYMRGVQSFGRVTISTILSALGKLLFSLLFVYIGWQTFGAVFGIVVAQLLALFYIQWQVHQAGFAFSRLAWFKKPNFKLLAPQVRYALFVMLVTLVITFQFSIDVLIAKRFFDPETAGLYAGVAIVARILYFLTASVAAVLLSSVHGQNAPRQNRKNLLFSGMLLVLLGGSTLALFTVFPSQILGLLMGSAYLQFVSLLPVLSGAIFVVSLANLLLTYCLALRLYQVTTPVIAGALLTFSLLVFRHANVEQLVESLLLGSSGLLLLTGGWLGWHLTQEARLESI